MLSIYAAWLKALDGKADEAIKTLEKMLQQAGGAPTRSTAEAADVLAMLYMARGEQEKAKKAVDFGLKVLQYQGVKSGYVLALLRGRLNSDIAAGEAKRLYNEAEKLRAERSSSRRANSSPRSGRRIRRISGATPRASASASATWA